MCGIAGLLNWQGERTCEALSRLAATMAEAVCHRGPDSAGVWCDPLFGLAFGHSRLAIIDLSEAGRQPMISRSGRYVLVFNGEIYNFMDLRKDLELDGVRFRGSSDTEVLLEGAENWGIEEAIRRSVGMFAFAIWDRSEANLHLFRDRMGEKPLYYGYSGKSFVFGSELKALRALPGWCAELSRDALSLYLRFGYIPAPYSIYEGIYKLSPGFSLTLSAEQVLNHIHVSPCSSSYEHLSAIHQRAYWSLGDIVKSKPLYSPESVGDVIEGLDQTLRKAVGRQMVADVPLGAFLSGGIDSTTIVAMMQAQSSRPIRTFTVSFGEQEFDEGPRAKKIAGYLGTDHTEIKLTPSEALEVIPRLPTIYDEPFADPSQIPTFLISQAARQHVKVCLSGDGGDEIFAGYNRYFWSERLWNGVKWVPLVVRKALAQGILAVGNTTWDRLHEILTTAGSKQPGFSSKLQKLALSIGKDDFAGLYESLLSCWQDVQPFLPGVLEPETVMSSSNGLTGGRSLVPTCLFWDCLFYLPNDNLVKVDRASMAVSLEMRAPMLDHTVVEQAWRTPESLLGKGESKWLLRQVLDRYVPRDLVAGPKRGFSVPLGHWLRTSLREWAEEILFDSEGPEVIDISAVRAKWQEHVTGRRDWNLGLWAIINLKAWLKHV